MAVPGPGLSLIPEDGAVKTALATQLHCWARMENGLTDPRVQYLTCKANGYFYLPPSICADYGPLPFTSEGNEIVCDPDAIHQMDRTIWPEDIAPLNVDTCTSEGVQLSAPTNLTVTDITDTSATVSWTAVPGASGYELQYRAAGGDWSAVEELTEPTFDLTGLELGTVYEVRVRAVGEEGGYVPSPYATVGFTTASEPPPEPLPAPAGLSAGTPTDTTVPLTWDAVDGADGYNVRYSLSGEDDWTEVAAGADPEFEVTGLEAGTAYDFQVQATDSTGEAGDSEWSASVTATTASDPVEPLPVPEGLTAGTPTATTVPLSWDATAGADSYVVRHSISGEDDWTETAVADETEVTIPSLTAETAYDFQVRASDSTGAAGDSDWSASVTATTAAETPEAASTSSGSARRGRRSAS